MSLSLFLDRNTPEEAIAELVDAVKQSPEQCDILVRLLEERRSFYEGRSANETIRIRGYVLAAFEQVGLPNSALQYVLEELESGVDAYTVAGAAKALRGISTPTVEVVPFLLKSVENIKYLDDALTFESYKPRWPLAEHTTALGEIFRTLGWLGTHAQDALPTLEAMLAGHRTDFSARSRAHIEQAIERIRSAEQATNSCCSDVEASPLTLFQAPPPRRSRRGDLFTVELQDQDGATFPFAAFFSGQPAILAFFYTRCNNPNKCSLTITKLARLQNAIVEQGLQDLLKTAAVTYDPDFDLPPRLKAYGQNRGVLFSDNNRILRTLTGFHDLQEYFQLGVNFTGATVNRHTLEVFILDSQGQIASTFSRLQWDVQEVLEQAQTLLAPR